MTSYDGAVTPGGPAAVRELERLRITKLAVDEKMANNAYLLRCTETGEQLLIDAADDAPRILELVGDGGLATVVTTHQHWDHHRALADVVAATGAQVVVGEPDAAAVMEQTGVAVDRTVSDGDEVRVGACTLRVVRVTGHTPGSIVLAYDDPAGHTHLWTGDSLFPGGVGNTFGDADAFATLIDDVEEKIFGVYDDDTWFYPGHGADSTLGAERPHLAAWRERGW
ncbi:MBL fold metallo-hydrolase [Nocardioides massiliensis]|uniref:Glyoxylase-like metal-dependent hydrolase (Beta-lactamase superfamily II) n=1 Tax=Nocardioides massiliensis TaxID=1325935 RepID=A0ABT9NRV8_9ACTN|nr:MBL fold metallo-hydrolase [Nocardioides massiliensis]MDP9823138.1 glyoxylase-like metal-dependent hydrolase (beta-lactamase superfamily II) [Nocardioides massiliensis]